MKFSSGNDITRGNEHRL